MSAFSILPAGGWNDPVNTLTPFPAILLQTGSVALLSWPAVLGAIGYAIKGGPADEPLTTVIDNQPGTTATVDGLLSGLTYAFEVVAFLGNGSTACSVLARNIDAVPLSVSASGTTAQLNFNAVAGASAYNVYVGTAPGQENPTPIPQTALPGGSWAEPNSSGFLVNNLTANTNYYFMVQPIFGSWVGSCGEGTVTQSSSVYYGLVSLQPPTAAEVQVLSSVQKTGYSGTYSATQSGSSANYPCVAFPTSFGVPGSFLIAGFPYMMSQAAITINGIAYTAFYVPTPTSATSVSIQVS